MSGKNVQNCLVRNVPCCLVRRVVHNCSVKGCAGYGTICSPSAQFVNVGSSHYLQLHLQHAAAAVSLKFLSRKFLISVSPIGIVQLSSPPAGWGREVRGLGEE